jgi:hypothetical protein
LYLAVPARNYPAVLYPPWKRFKFSESFPRINISIVLSDGFKIEDWRFPAVYAYRTLCVCDTTKIVFNGSNWINGMV